MNMTRQCRYPWAVAVLAALALTLGGCGGDAEPDPFTRLVDDTPDSVRSAEPQWQLVWSDEFDGVELNSVDWTVEIGTGDNGWGNNELQYYRAENLSVENGLLTIEARQEAFAGSAYTSARIKTEGKRFFRFGRIEVRARLPEGQGLWPAVWMLGESFSSIGWPFSGEIDIMEMIGGSGREDEVFGTIHWDEGGHQFSGGLLRLTDGTTFADDFHIFSIEWDSREIRWYADGVLYHQESIATAARSELREEFFLLLNVAVGGNLPGSPDGTTSFPQQMQVDYVRVYQAM